jgi:hypothetical protein
MTIDACVGLVGFSRALEDELLGFATRDGLTVGAIPACRCARLSPV